MQYGQEWMLYTEGFEGTLDQLMKKNPLQVTKCIETTSDSVNLLAGNSTKLGVLWICSHLLALFLFFPRHLLMTIALAEFPLTNRLQFVPNTS